MKRRDLLRALGAGCGWVCAGAVRARSAGASLHIGYLSAESAAYTAMRLGPLREGLREYGWQEGRNLVIDSRFADGLYDRLPALAAELVALKVDLLVTAGTKATLGARHATSTLPIVMQSAGDVVVLGIVGSLARPGGNVTGLVNMGRELGPKRLQLLREAVPQAQKIGYLVNPDNPAFGPNLQAMWTSARALKLALQPVEAHGTQALAAAFAELARQRVDAVVLQDDTAFVARLDLLAELVAAHRLPCAGGLSFRDAGFVIAYGPEFRKGMDRRAAYFVDRIARGAKPGDLPIEQPSQFQLVVNQRAAATLGLTLPKSLLLRADEVIP